MSVFRIRCNCLFIYALSRCLAMDTWLLLHYCGFQASCHNTNKGSRSERPHWKKNRQWSRRLRAHCMLYWSLPREQTCCLSYPILSDSKLVLSYWIVSWQNPRQSKESAQVAPSCPIDCLVGMATNHLYSLWPQTTAYFVISQEVPSTT
jgi:hypothetical protein